MNFARKLLSPFQAWYASSVIGRANEAQAKSAVRLELTAKILSERSSGHPLEEYLWGVGKKRD